MIARANRFHGRGNLQRHYKQSRSVRAGAMTLRYAVNSSQSYRLTVVVSRKVSKSAVVRNRIRRRIYERVRILSSLFTKSYDLAVIVYDEKLATLASVQLEKSLREMFQKAGVVSSRTPEHDIVESKE